MRMLLAVVAISWFVSGSQPASLVTSSVNVRLRETPSTAAAVVRELPIGTALVQVPPDAGTKAVPGWVRVRTTDGADGWISSTLARPFDPARPLEAIEAIVRARLPSAGRFEGEAPGTGESFATRIQLLRLVEGAPIDPADRETAARFALHRLRATLYAAGAIPFRRGGLPPYAAWITAQVSVLRYNEPGANWLLEYDAVRRAYDQHRDTAVSDEIAWLLVTNGLGGECEGDLPCAVSWSNRLEGEYLRLQPAGAFVAVAHSRIASHLGGYLTNVESFPRVLAEFVPGRHCGELKASLDPLLAAVRASASPRQDDALAALARYARLCEG